MSSSLFPCPRTLCYFVAMLAYQGLTIQSIKTYIAVVKHDNITSGGTDLPHTPCLRQVLQGAHRMQGSLRSKSQPQTRLPISLHLLHQLRVVWSEHLDDFKGCARWAATTLCFFDFFQSGEITIPQRSGFNSAIHLTLGGCGSGQYRSSNLCQGPLEAIKMRSVWKRGGCVRSFNRG